MKKSDYHVIHHHGNKLVILFVAIFSHNALEQFSFSDLNLVSVLIRTYNLIFRAAQRLPHRWGQNTGRNLVPGLD